MRLNDKIKTVAFDADDTLWVNEPYFQEATHKFISLLHEYGTKETIAREFLKTDIDNIDIYGFGVKSFILSMIETANRVSNMKVSGEIIDEILKLGHNILQKPIELLDKVQTTLEQLNGSYRLIIATKGDMLDQERKLQKSGLEAYFHHIEIMSDKRVDNYQKLLAHLDCKAENFLMIGNSLKSDIQPVIELGGYAAHIPYHVTWEYENSAPKLASSDYIRLSSIDEILEFLC